MATRPMLRRTAKEQAKDEKGYRDGVLHPSPVWQRHFKAAVANGSLTEIRGLLREQSRAVDRLEGFLKDPEFYGR